MYDEENIDLEEQMYQNDILDDTDSDITEEETEEDDYNTDKYILSKFFLDTQLNNVPDKKKQIIRLMHKKTGKIYEGIVIGRDKKNSDRYVFDMYSVIDGVVGTEKKYKIFNINDIKKVN